MTVKELVDALAKMPPNALVYYEDYRLADHFGGPEDAEPIPKLQIDGRVLL